MIGYLKGNIRSKHLFVVLLMLLVFMFTMLMAASENVYAETIASGTCGDNLTWVLDDEGTPDTYTLTISGTGAMTEYSGFRDIPWESYDQKITKVVIGDGVTTICNYAFYQCSNLAELSLPTSLTSIGNQGFMGCAALQTVRLPEGLKSLGNSAFQGCSNLESVNVPNSLKTIGNSAFRSCNKLQGPLNLSGCTSLGTFAFQGCTSLNNITLPSTINELPNGLFQGCTSLSSTTLPSTIKEIPSNLFNGCTSLSSITIPEGVTKIGGSSFQSTGLTSIEMPKSVTEIGASAFRDCTSLEIIMMPDSVTEIGTSAFSGCTSLDSVTFSNNLRFIGPSNDPLIEKAVDATAGSGLTVEINGYRPGIGDYAGQLQKITVMNGSQEAQGSFLYTFSGKGNLYEDTDTSSTEPNNADDSLDISPTALSPKLYYYAPNHELTSFSCIVYKIEDHTLKKVAQGTKSVTPPNQSNGEALKNSLANLSVIMIKGETMTLGQILGRAGLAHVNCTYVKIPTITDFTSDQTEIVELFKITSELRRSRFTAKSPGIVDAIFQIYSQNCEYQGSQFNSNSPYDATLKLIVIGEPKVTPDVRKITISVDNIPDNLPQGSVVKVTLNGETKDVVITDGSGTVEFTGLDPDTDYPYSIDIGNDTTGYSRIYKTAKTLNVADITTQPEDLEWRKGDTTARSFTVEAESNTGGTLSYQWYKINESGVEEAISSADSKTYNISNPEDMEEGEYKYFCRITSSDDPDYPLDTRIATATVTTKSPVTITTADKEMIYSAEPIAIPVDGMFDIPDGAGEATYIVTPGTGAGTYDTTTAKLTVTKAGTFTIKVNTAETDDYFAGEATATLTVNKAEGAATVTLADQTVGKTDYEPSLASENYSTAAADVTIKYFKKDGDAYTELTEKPTELGEYRVAVTFKENDLYVEKTVTADYKITDTPGPEPTPTPTPTPTPEPTPTPADQVTYDDLTDSEKVDADKIVENFNVDKDTAAKMLRTGEELGVPLDTMLLSTKVIKALKDDKDPKGSSFAKLTARAVKRGKTTMRLQWKTLPQADGYLIYSNKCGLKNKYKLVRTVKNGKTNKWNRKKLKKKTYYKYLVVAYKNVAGQKLPIGASVTVHCTTKADKNTIAKAVKLNKTSLTIAQGKTVSLKGKEVKMESKKIIKKHRAVNYESLNPGVAKVSKSTGKVTGVSPGKTTIYVYCQNGVYKKVSVTVK